MTSFYLVWHIYNCFVVFIFIHLIFNTPYRCVRNKKLKQTWLAAIGLGAPVSLPSIYWALYPQAESLNYNILNAFLKLIYLSICLSVYLSICLSIYLSVCMSVWVSVCLSVCLSVYLSIFPENPSLFVKVSYKFPFWQKTTFWNFVPIYYFIFVMSSFKSTLFSGYVPLNLTCFRDKSL